MYCEDDNGDERGWRGDGLAGLANGEKVREVLEGDDAGFFTELISPLVLPSKVILARGESSGRAESGVDEKGGFCKPGLGEMSSFWFSVGIERFSDSVFERS